MEDLYSQPRRADKSATIMDLIGGYDTYAEASDLVPGSADAPATSPVCGYTLSLSAAVSVGYTVKKSC